MRIYDFENFDSMDINAYNYTEESSPFNIPSYVHVYMDDILLTPENTFNSNKFVINKLPEGILNNTSGQKLHIDLSKNYYNRIQLFIDIIENCLPHVNLGAFYENFKNFKMEKAKKNLFNFWQFSKYKATFVHDDKENKIVFYKCDIDTVIYHELLHMASKRRYKSNCFIGYNQNIENYEIGEGLNEGYTDVLSLRYFSRYGSEPANYFLESYLSELIELLVGQKNMETWYFNSDLYSLCDSLNLYLRKNEIVLLLSSIDKISKRFSRKFYSMQVKKLYREVALLLINLLLKKYIELNEKKTTEEDIIEFKEKLFNLVSKGYNDGYDGIVALNEVDNYNILQKINKIEERYLCEKTSKKLTNSL